MTLRDTAGDERDDTLLTERPDASLDDLTVAEYAAAVHRAGENLVSVVVPTRNDRRFLRRCVEEVDDAMRAIDREYELIVVDDRSIDGTPELARSLQDRYPVRVVEQAGKRGRSVALKEGVDQAVGASIVLLDPDVRFATADFGAMLGKLDDATIVVANRSRYATLWHAVFGRAFRWVFGNLLLSVEADIRSGIKMFRRSLLHSLRFDPEFDPRLGYDAVLLYHAKRAGWNVASVPVGYTRPVFHHGFGAAVAVRALLAFDVVRLTLSHALRSVLPFLYPPAPIEYFSAGFTNVNDYLFLTSAQSAKGHITRETVSLAFVAVLAGAAFMFGVSSGFGVPLLTVIAFGISAMYVTLMSFKVAMLAASMPTANETIGPEDLAAVTDEELPVVSILIPLYREKDIIPQIFRYLSDFDYPQEKLDIIFILESTDTETAEAFLAMHPPSHFKALLSPDVFPKTKPKAMNVAFGQAKGDVVVIFDAEVLPERDQLKKAYLTFKRNPGAMYLHSRMDVYNAETNWITHLYTAEFSYFYHYFMPGLVASKYPVPISGHSTYFRKHVIEKVGAWDAYNVAEDCDIGIRLYRKGFGSGMMLDSHTWEQSTTTIPTWVRQRTRWIQGFIQTSMVQLRYPFLLKRELKSWKNFIVFLMLVPGNVVLNILNIVQWAMFALWHMTHAPFLQVAYSGVTLYMATTCFILGNFFFTFFGLYALYVRKHYSSVPWGFLMFVYWIMLGIATVRATLHLFLHPHKWDKTQHVAATPARHG